MKEHVWLALHEERYPLAVFRTEEAAKRWVADQAEAVYTFTIEQIDVDE